MAGKSLTPASRGTLLLFGERPVHSLFVSSSQSDGLIRPFSFTLSSDIGELADIEVILRSASIHMIQTRSQ